MTRQANSCTPRGTALSRANMIRESVATAARPADGSAVPMVSANASAAPAKRIASVNPAIWESGDATCYYLTVHEVRRAAVQEAAALDFAPGHEPIENLAPQESPHGRPVHQEVLDVLGPELLPVTLA